MLYYYNLFRTFLKEKKMTIWEAMVRDDMKIHVCPMDMGWAVQENIAERYGDKDWEEKVIDAAYFDMPGMAMVNRKEYTFDFEGLALTIPACDMSDVERQLRTYELREVCGHKFMKLHGFLVCIVLSERQVPLFHKRILEVLEEAQAIGMQEEFHMYETLQDIDGVIPNKPEGYDAMKAAPTN